MDEPKDIHVNGRQEIRAVGGSEEEVSASSEGSWWDVTRPHLKRYGKSLAIAGPFGVVVTGVGDSAPYVAKEVRRAIDGLRGFKD